MFYILISNVAFYIYSLHLAFFFFSSIGRAPNSFLQLNSFPLCEYDLTISNWKDVGDFLSFDIIYNIAMNNTVCKSFHMDADIFIGHISDLHLMDKRLYASVILIDFTKLPPQ